MNLSIHQGMLRLLGRNSAGKTTLMKTLAILLRKKDGKVMVCGVPIKNAREVRENIGCLPQEASMHPSMRGKKLWSIWLSYQDWVDRRGRNESTCC